MMLKLTEHVEITIFLLYKQKTCLELPFSFCISKKHVGITIFLLYKQKNFGEVLIFRTLNSESF